MKESVISSEPTTVTGTTIDRPGERALPTSNLFSEKVRGSPCEGVRGLFYSARVMSIHGNIQPIRIPPSFTGD